MTTAYWWTQIPNFGDLLAPLILEHYSGLTASWARIQDADLVVTGSILEHIPRGWNGHVAGAGRIREGSDLNIGGSTVHAIRGPLSAVGVRGDFAMGDPGLLADEMVTVPTRDIELGLVPHWSDLELEWNPTFMKYDPLIIRPWDDPLDVIRQIGRCKKIVASSLHGIILADAFGIPRRTEQASRLRDNKYEGNFFKFRDYNKSVGLEYEVGKVQTPTRGVVEDRKHELFDAFAAIGRDWNLRTKGL